MAEKRYYWLKLNEDYLSSPKIKKLRKIAGGDTFTIIYLKMQLLSIKNEGIITFDGIEGSLEEELALKLDEELENVALTLSYLKAQGLIENNESNQFLLPEACKNIGSECESAERVRRFRERKNKIELEHQNKEEALPGNASVTDVKRNSISISNSNNILYIEELFTKIWAVYPRKKSREYAKKTWIKKLKKFKTKEDILDRAKKIGILLTNSKQEWERLGTREEYIPYFSSWLNDNVPDLK